MENINPQLLYNDDKGFHFRNGLTLYIHRKDKPFRKYVLSHGSIGNKTQYIIDKLVELYEKDLLSKTSE